MCGGGGGGGAVTNIVRGAFNVEMKWVVKGKWKTGMRMCVERSN